MCARTPNHFEPTTLITGRIHSVSLFLTILDSVISPYSISHDFENSETVDISSRCAIDTVRSGTVYYVTSWSGTCFTAWIGSDTRFTVWTCTSHTVWSVTSLTACSLTDVAVWTITVLFTARSGTVSTYACRTTSEYSPIYPPLIVTRITLFRTISHSVPTHCPTS